MSKAILLILILALVYWYFWGRFRNGESGARRGASAPPPASPEKMVDCAYCGLHVPESESIAAAGRRYCSDEHRRLGAP